MVDEEKERIDFDHGISRVIVGLLAVIGVMNGVIIWNQHECLKLLMQMTSVLEKLIQ